MEICSLVKQDFENYSRHALFCTWRMMNYRCFSDVHTNFKTYGGAGITVCNRWRWDNVSGFSNFVEDMGVRPEKHTLDREDPYGNYEPANCRWADKKTQQNNFRKERNSASGVAGVVPWDKRWAAQIAINGITVNINYFSTVEEALAAREEAEQWKRELGEDAALERINANIVKLDNGKRAYGRKTSKYYGVCKHHSGKWRAATSRRDSEGKLRQIHLGVYETEEEAHQAMVNFLEQEKKSASSI